MSADVPVPKSPTTCVPNTAVSTYAIYIIYIITVTYPDWAEKYRGKGRTIRKVRNGYGLYQCTSVYVSGQKYPKSIQKYLGMITEKDGFIRRIVKPSATSLNNTLHMESYIQDTCEVDNSVYQTSPVYTHPGYPLCHFLSESTLGVAHWYSH